MRFQARAHARALGQRPSPEERGTLHCRTWPARDVTPFLRGRRSSVGACHAAGGVGSSTSSSTGTATSMSASSAVWQFVKNTAWCIPIAIAFSDSVASVVKARHPHAGRRQAAHTDSSTQVTHAWSVSTQVQGLSMQPTLNGDPARSDWVLVEKVSCKWLHHYERGAVVVLWCVLFWCACACLRVRWLCSRRA